MQARVAAEQEADADSPTAPYAEDAIDDVDDDEGDSIDDFLAGIPMEAT
jgi:hypothetical protein